jgi:hypothetical protein
MREPPLRVVKLSARTGLACHLERFVHFDGCSFVVRVGQEPRTLRTELTTAALPAYSYLLSSPPFLFVRIKLHFHNMRDLGAFVCNCVDYAALRQVITHLDAKDRTRAIEEIRNSLLDQFMFDF